MCCFSTYLHLWLESTLKRLYLFITDYLDVTQGQIYEALNEALIH